MAKLATSLVNLRKEIDVHWPNRDRRTDGWYANPRDRISYGHNPDLFGNVHAIDVDKDGINPDWIVSHIYRKGGVLWYVIWNRKIWSVDYGWKPRAYYGKSPHTDHMHIEIKHTPGARGYRGSWGVKAGGASTIGTAPGSGTEWGTADYLAQVELSGNLIKRAGDYAFGFADSIRNIRK